MYMVCKDFWGHDSKLLRKQGRTNGISKGVCLTQPKKVNHEGMTAQFHVRRTPINFLTSVVLLPTLTPLLLQAQTQLERGVETQAGIEVALTPCN